MRQPSQNTHATHPQPAVAVHESQVVLVGHTAAATTEAHVAEVVARSAAGQVVLAALPVQYGRLEELSPEPPEKGKGKG